MYFMLLTFLALNCSESGTLYTDRTSGTNREIILLVVLPQLTVPYSTNLELYQLYSTILITGSVNSQQFPALSWVFKPYHDLILAHKNPSQINADLVENSEGNLLGSEAPRPKISKVEGHLTSVDFSQFLVNLILMCIFQKLRKRCLQFGEWCLCSYVTPI